MTQNNGHCVFTVIRNHIFGTNQKPIRNFLSVNNTNFYLSRTVSKLSQIISQIFAFNRGCLSLIHSLGWTLKFIFWRNLVTKETRIIALLYGWKLFRYLEPCLRCWRTWQTDWQTDWQAAFSNSDPTQPTKNQKISTQPNQTQPNPWVDPTHGQLWRAPT